MRKTSHTGMIRGAARISRSAAAFRFAKENYLGKSELISF